MTYRLGLQHMPGPTSEAKEAQLRQLDLLHGCYDAANAANQEHTPEVLAARAAYDASVLALEEMLGADAHCNHVDPDLWQFFSDAYKSDAGFRPSFLQFTRKQTLDCCIAYGYLPAAT